jgi:hypothetical protein
LTEGEVVALEEKLIKRLDELIAKGNQVLGTHVSYPPNAIGFPPHESGVFAEWRNQTLSFLVNLLGAEHIYSRNFDENVKQPYSGQVKNGLGILRAVSGDLSSGWLNDIRTLVSAEVFNDLLEQAEQLQQAGYKDAAAVLAGAVLERHLRAMCVRRVIGLLKPNGKHKMINDLNDELGKGGAYNALKKKQITAWADLRNNAAHGNTTAYTDSDVDALLRDVSDFCANFS